MQIDPRVIPNREGIASLRDDGPDDPDRLPTQLVAFRSLHFSSVRHSHHARGSMEIPRMQHLPEEESQGMSISSHEEQECS